VNGAGASAIACANLFKSNGVPNKNIIMIDRKGVLYRGRDNLDQWKSAHAIDTKLKTLEEAIKGADVFLGLSVKNILSKNMVKTMAKNPIIFALANPDPEINPEDVHEARDDAIVATGRSDYPNQVNNFIGFPYNVCENPTERSRVLLVTLNAYPLFFRDLATIVAASPVPISSTRLDLMSSIFSSASFTAIEPSDIPPLPIPVEFLIRVPILIDLSNNLFSLLPDALTFLAAEIDSLI